MATVTPTTCASPLGRMIAINYGSVAPMSVLIDKKPPQRLGLCTQMEVNQSVIAQFQNTFGSFIYITPFGDKPGDIRFTFIVNTLCPAPEKPADNAIDYYIKNRLQPTQIIGSTGNTVYLKKTSPIIVAIGNLSLTGFVTSLDITGTVEGGPIVSARLSMTGWPSA